MRIAIVTPAAIGTRKGNRITANRWARLLRSLGHRVSVLTTYETGKYETCRFDALVALHAMKSSRSVVRFRKACPQARIVVLLTGTDVYGDLGGSRAAMISLELADRLVMLQPLAIAEIPRKYRRKASVIYQSVEPVRLKATRQRRQFRIIVVGHLRPVKDPFRAAMAVRALPDSSRIEVLHYGAALSDGMRRRALQEQARNPRYRWMGDRSRSVVMRALVMGDLCVLSSRSEGGANAVGEAIVMGTPVVSARIAGSIGLLGRAYPGYFPVGDTKSLSKLLLRAEADRRFYDRLKAACDSLVPLFDPKRERAALCELFSSTD